MKQIFTILALTFGILTYGQDCEASFTYTVDENTNTVTLTAQGYSLDSTFATAYDWSIMGTMLSGQTVTYQYNSLPLQLCVDITFAGGCTANSCGTVEAQQTDPCFGFYGYTYPTYTSYQGAMDGAIDLTVYGGTAPYLYMWNTADQTQDINNLEEGYYTVIVEDANGCSFSQSEYVYTENWDSTIWNEPVDTFYVDPVDSCFEVTVNNVVIADYTVNTDNISVTWNLFDVDGNLIASFTMFYDGTIDTEGVYNFEISFVNCAKALNSNDSYMAQVYIDPAVATGVKQINTISSELNIYPNPVKDILTIEAQSISTVEIMDINGKIVRTINNDNSIKTIDVSSLTQGIYFVKTGSKVQKLVKL